MFCQVGDALNEDSVVTWIVDVGKFVLDQMYRSAKMAILYCIITEPVEWSAVWIGVDMFSR